MRINLYVSVGNFTAATRPTPTMAPGVRGLNPVLAAEAAEGAGGYAQCLTGVLVTGVDPGYAFNSFSGDLFHHISRYRMHFSLRVLTIRVLALKSSKRKAANSFSEPAASSTIFKKKTVGGNPYGRELSIQFSNLRVCLGLQGLGPRSRPVVLAAAALYARRPAGPSRICGSCCPDWRMQSRPADQNGRPTTGHTADRRFATGTDAQTDADVRMHSGRDTGSRHVWD